MREWLLQSYVGSKLRGQWTDLWSMACQVDFLVGDCKTEEALYKLLGTSDACEIILRHLSAYIYSARTGDWWEPRRCGQWQLQALLPT